MSTPRSNPKHKALFTLPPTRKSRAVTVALQPMPEPKNATGDEEIDTIIWLRDVISTGQPDFIETALITASKIATPIKEIEQRIMRRVAEENPGNNLACLPVIGFTDLKALAERVTRKQRLLADGKARFGDNIWETTPAETLCAEALGGAAYEPNGFIEDGARCKFRETPETNPTTLSECLHEIRFWDTLYDLRNAIDSYFDYPQVVWARKDFLFDLLAEIRPRSRKEASSVLDYLIKEERMDRSGVNDILRNLVR